MEWLARGMVSDWLERRARAQAVRTTRWRVLQLIVAAWVVVDTVLGAYPPISPAVGAFRWVARAALPALLAVWGLTWWETRPRRYRRAALRMGLIAAAAVLAYLSRPGNGFSAAQVAAAFAVPVLAWSGLALNPRLLADRALGADAGLPPGEIAKRFAIGIALGGSLGLHLLFTSFFTTYTALENFPATLPPLLTWAFLTRVGLVALGEELLFRILPTALLRLDERPYVEFLIAAGSTALLNTLLYIPPLLAGSVGPVYAVLGYRVVLYLGNMLLFRRHRSFIMCLTTHTILSMALMVAAR